LVQQKVFYIEAKQLLIKDIINILIAYYTNNIYGKNLKKDKYIQVQRKVSAQDLYEKTHINLP